MYYRDRSPCTLRKHLFDRAYYSTVGTENKLFSRKLIILARFAINLSSPRVRKLTRKTCEGRACVGESEDKEKDKQKEREKKNDSMVMERRRLVKAKKRGARREETGEMEEFSLALGDFLSLLAAILRWQLHSKCFHESIIRYISVVTFIDDIF